MPFPWEAVGRFTGHPTLIVPGGRVYLFVADGFGFTRANGQTVTPKTMRTDDGSIPRPLWNIPGLNPWDYTPAFVLHDWLYVLKHGIQAGVLEGPGVTFAEANLILAEAIWTMMKTGIVPLSELVVHAIYLAVSSQLGKEVWDRVWTAEEVKAVLSPIL